MSQIKSSIKSMKKDAQRHAQNAALKTKIRTLTKKTLEAVESGDADAAQAAYSKATSTIDKAASKGVIHKNNAARKKSRLYAKMQHEE